MTELNNNTVNTSRKNVSLNYRSKPTYFKEGYTVNRGVGREPLSSYRHTLRQRRRRLVVVHRYIGDPRGTHSCRTFPGGHQTRRFISDVSFVWDGGDVVSDPSPNYRKGLTMSRPRAECRPQGRVIRLIDTTRNMGVFSYISHENRDLYVDSKGN